MTTATKKMETNSHREEKVEKNSLLHTAKSISLYASATKTVHLIPASCRPRQTMQEHESRPVVPRVPRTVTPT